LTIKAKESLIPEIKTLTELADHLTGILTGVSKDIDRGLSIMNQIAKIYEPFFPPSPVRGRDNIYDNFAL